LTDRNYEIHGVTCTTDMSITSLSRVIATLRFLQTYLNMPLYHLSQVVLKRSLLGNLPWWGIEFSHPVLPLLSQWTRDNCKCSWSKKQIQSFHNQPSVGMSLFIYDFSKMLEIEIFDKCVKMTCKYVKEKTPHCTVMLKTTIYFAN